MFLPSVTKAPLSTRKRSPEMSSFTYSSRASARLARHVVTVAILGAAGWLHGALQLFALSPKRLCIETPVLLLCIMCSGDLAFWL